MVMKLSEKVLESMSMIDEKYLEASEKEPVRSFSWKPVLSFAAVFALIFAVIIRPGYSSSPNVSFDRAESVTEELPPDSMFETEQKNTGVLGGANSTVQSQGGWLTQRSEDYDAAEMSGEVLLDQKLSAYLEEIGMDDEVLVTIEYTDSRGSGTESLSSPETAETLTPIRMSKREILDYVNERDMTCIIHLYEEK